MILGIDASNIRRGGTVTHLVALLREGNPLAHGFSKVIVWGGCATLGEIEERPWLVKQHQVLLDRNLFFRTYWQRFRLSKLARKARCHILFVPGGSYAGDFHPVVTVSSNMLPFEWSELRRLGWSLRALKMIILRWTQSRTFSRADGLIFLTKYARDGVMSVVKSVTGRMTIIPHGVDIRFFRSPREQRPLSRYSADQPFRILYVSTVDVYKHQWHTAEAVAQLRKRGFPVVLDLVGPSYRGALARLQRTLNRIDPNRNFVRYKGSVRHDEIHKCYEQADLCLFASSCENMPNILLEEMASGLPTACSSRGPMPEMLGDAGIYFDPENPQDIARALRELIEFPEMRALKAKDSFERVKTCSWHRCAHETFGFLASVAGKSI